jgi:hypothetical protein
LKPNRNDSVQLYGVRRQSAAATPLLLLPHAPIPYTKRLLQSKSTGDTPSPQGRIAIELRLHSSKSLVVFSLSSLEERAGERRPLFVASLI